MLCVEASIVIYTTCKSNVSVNHLHLHVQSFYTYISLIVVDIYIFTLTRPRVNVLGHVSVNIKIICKFTLSLGLLSPQILLLGVSIK